MLRKIDNPVAVRGQTRLRGLTVWVLLAATTLLIAMVAPFLAGLWYTDDDLGAFHLPLRAFYAEQLAGGEPFDWMPGLYCGLYLTGEGQAGVYHPFHIAIYRFLPLRAAMACELLASYPLLFAGAWLFLRRWLVRPEAAAFGGLVLAFCGFNLLHFIHPNAVAVIAHLPWLLWTIDLSLRRPGRRAWLAAGGVALLTGSQILLGYPQYVWFSFLAEAAYAIWIGGCCWRMCRLAGAVALGVMLGAVQLLPTIDALGQSTRQSTSAEFANAGSLHPINLVQLVAPYLFARRVAGQNTHELGLYFGAVPLMLLMWLLTQSCRLRQPVIAAAVFGSLALLLAFGQYAPLYRLQQWLPVVGGFRFPCRYIVLVQFAVGVLAAIAMARLTSQTRRVAFRSAKAASLCGLDGERDATSAERKATHPAGAWLPLVVPVAASVLAAAVGIAWHDPDQFAPVPAILAGPLLIAAAAGLVALAARGRRAALVGLVLLTTADLGFYGLSYSVYPRAETMEAFLASIDRPGSEAALLASGGFRVVAGSAPSGRSGLRTGNQILLAGLRRADGYAGLEPKRNFDFGDVAALRMAGVHWVKRSEETSPHDGLTPCGNGWLQVRDPLPRVRLVSSCLWSDDPANDINRIPVESMALVAEPLSLSGGPAGTVSLITDRPGRLDIAVACTGQQLLVVAESFHPGWQAQVDGRPRPVVRVNGDFLGCVVGPDDREVSLAFQPRSLRLGKLLSSLALAVVAATGIASLLLPCENAPSSSRLAKGCFPLPSPSGG